MPWIIGAIISALLALIYSPDFRVFLEDVFYTILYLMVIALKQIVNIYLTYVSALFTKVLNLLPPGIAIPVTELRLLDLLNLYMVLSSIRKIFRL
jgi:hypothetical protein